MRGGPDHVRAGLARPVEHLPDRRHAADQPRLVLLGQLAEQLRDLLARAPVERREDLGPAGGEPDELLARVGGRALALHEPVVLEAGQDAAEVAGVEAEQAAQLPGLDPVGLRQLEQHACLGQ
ncbi:hypothetical protein GCM10020001_081230 [Nonomuraea salmonea]